MGDDKSGQCAHGYYGLCPHCYEALRAANARLQAWHDAVMGQPSFTNKHTYIRRPQPLAKE